MVRQGPGGRSCRRGRGGLLLQSQHTPAPAQFPRGTRPQPETRGRLHGKGAAGREPRAHTRTPAHTHPRASHSHPHTRSRSTHTRTPTCTHRHAHTHGHTRAPTHISRITLRAHRHTHMYTQARTPTHTYAAHTCTHAHTDALLCPPPTSPVLPRTPPALPPWVQLQAARGRGHQARFPVRLCTVRPRLMGCDSSGLAAPGPSYPGLPCRPPQVHSWRERRALLGSVARGKRGPFSCL